MEDSICIKNRVFNNSTTLTGTIKAGGYYLIQQAAGSGGIEALPTADIIGNITMDNFGNIEGKEAAEEVIEVIDVLPENINLDDK